MTRFEKTVKKRWRICPFSFFLCLSVCLSVYEQITIIGPYTQAYKLPALRSTIVPVRVQDLCFLKGNAGLSSSFRATGHRISLEDFSNSLKSLSTTILLSTKECYYWEIELVNNLTRKLRHCLNLSLSRFVRQVWRHHIRHFGNRSILCSAFPTGIFLC